jgi:hypothetical protein
MIFDLKAKGIHMSSMLTPFHLAIPVHDLQKAKKFYGEIMQCEEGRSSDHWVDYNFFGHQLVVHLDAAMDPTPHINPVDGKEVPVPHFGVVLEWLQWEGARDRFVAADIPFVIEPYIRFEGQAGEQATFFLNDFSGNALEFKTFRDFGQLFAK